MNRYPVRWWREKFCLVKLSGTLVATAQIIRLQTEGIAANMLNKQMQTTNKGWYSEGDGQGEGGANNLLPDLDGFFSTEQ
jgi:hypothetical protein